MSDASGSKAAMLAELRGRIRRMEGIGGGDGGRVMPLGVPALDGALPDGGLPLACLHELIGDEDPFNGAVTGFGAAILSRIAGRGGEQGGQVVWITRGADLYAPGIAAYGLTPDRLIVVRARRDADILWAMEEALRCRALEAVLGEVDDIDMVASRRLQLAAETSGVTGLLLRTARRRLAATASMTRWSLSATHSEPLAGEPGLGFPRWHIRLLRCRGGRPGEWVLEWRGDDFALVSIPPVFIPESAAGLVGVELKKSWRTGQTALSG